MSYDSTSKPRDFPLGALVRYAAIGSEWDDARGRVAGWRALGDGSFTLELVCTDGSGPIDIHDSWCSLVEEPKAACEKLLLRTEDGGNAVVELISDDGEYCYVSFVGTGVEAQVRADELHPFRPDEVEESVIEEIRRRRDVGRKKYKTTMERDDLTVEQWAQHAKEEALDFAIYLEKLKRKIAEREESVKLDGTEGLGTFGGESRDEDFEFAEYGLVLGKVSVHGLTPSQAIQLACTLVDHLIRNGHDFELQKHTHQDQYEALVCIDQK